jgi:sugar lactone lactonase YvrE
MLAMTWSLAFAVLLVLPGTFGLDREQDGFQYVIVSQPRLKSVTYAKVNIFQYDAGNETYPLVTAGLKNPLGLAVDNVRQRLFVADSEAGKVFMYKLIFDKGNLVTDGQQHVAVSGLEPRWVSVNEAGDIYVSDEPSNQIAFVSAAQLKKVDATPNTVFAGSSLAVVSSPGGVAVDGNEVFWVNKAEGISAGTLIRGRYVPGRAKGDQGADLAKILAQNVDKAFGCCVAGTNVFFTGEEKYVYAVKKTGGTAVPVVDSLVAPRGCAWDGSSTVYIADRSGNALSFFPSSMHSLELAQVHKMITVEDPFGVAVALVPRGGFMSRSDHKSVMSVLVTSLALAMWIF